MPPCKRLCLKDLEKLADIMSSGERNLANAAMKLGAGPSGLRKTIPEYRVLEPQRPSLNQCGKRMRCKLTDACRPCPCRTAHECRGRKRGCNARCEEFQPGPDCGRVNGFPYCRDGCPKRQCRLSKSRLCPAKAREGSPPSGPRRGRDHAWARKSGSRSPPSSRRSPGSRGNPSPRSTSPTPRSSGPPSRPSTTKPAGKIPLVRR